MDLRPIIKRCQAGDREALGILYQSYLTPMKRVVAHYVHNPESVRDILHDGFVIAFDSIDSLKDASKVESWLTTIMRNLALQYLKKESNQISIPLQDVAVLNDTDNDRQHTTDMSWDELSKIINRLPEGYGKVFRLAVLDGLSHKEISTLLGIAPHSSSSQLAHAKAMMRRLITQYRAEIGALSIIAIILFVWYGPLKNRDNTPPDRIITKKSDKDTHTIMVPVSYPLPQEIPANEPSAGKYGGGGKSALLTDSVPRDNVTNDSVANDTIKEFPCGLNREELRAKEELPPIHSPQPSDEPQDWSLSLAYTGNPGQNDLNHYRIPNPNLPDGADPDDGDIEVTEKSHHYMPLVVGLSLNKSLTSRWSVETGLRYTFLRSDFHSESRLMNKATVQRIHYIGVPLKINYRIFTHKGLSLYGQCGVALDIPLHGTQSVREYSPESHSPNREIIHLQAPPQWSVEGGVGIQYRITPSFGIYAEPSLRYYFNPGSAIKTIRQETPYEFTIPIGLRLTW